jgi:hypothetical protein
VFYRHSVEEFIVGLLSKNFKVDSVPFLYAAYGIPSFELTAHVVQSN